MQPLQWYTEAVVEPALGDEEGLGKWFVVGVTVLAVCCGDVQRRRQQSATTLHRALPVCGWPALGITKGTARPNAASAVCTR